MDINSTENSAASAKETDDVIRLRHSLTVRTLLAMGIRITLVVLTVSILSYWYIESRLTKETYERLGTFIKDKTAKESGIFETAKANHQLFKTRFLALLDQAPDVTPAEFDAIFKKMDDGTIRTHRALYDGIVKPDQLRSSANSGFVGVNAPVEQQSFRNRLVYGYRVIDRYAAAWTSQFSNLYLSFPENAVLVHWPEFPWALEVESTHNVNQQEWLTADATNANAQRQTKWTGIYFDDTASQWVVSCDTPVDHQGKHIANIGHDLQLDEFIERSYNDNLEGGYNIIFISDGHLLAHPDKIEQLNAEPGSLNIKEMGDPTLRSVYQQVMEKVDDLDGNVAVFLNKEDDTFLAVSRILGPDMWSVTVYPKHLLSSTARSMAEFVFKLSIFSLVIEMLMLFMVLRFKIVEPINMFAAASSEVREGHYDKVASGQIALPESRKDEVGMLARTFRTMAVEINRHVESLENAQQQLVMQEKMASLGTLTAGVAHEINNPTNFVHVGVQNLDDNLVEFKQFIYGLLGEDGDTEQQIVDTFHEHFQSLDGHIMIIKEGTGRIKKIVQNLREFTSLDDRDMQEADIVECLESTLNLVKTKYLEIAEFIIELEPTPLIDCHPAQLNQVFMNIIINACDAIEEAQEHRSTAMGMIRVGCKQVEGMIVVTVQDNGCGMNEETEKKLFEPFYTTKVVGKGTGLGMAISFGIINDHGGTIEVESTVNVGSLIRIKLPLEQSR